MRSETYKGCEIIVMREFSAVGDGHNLLNALSDDAKPIISVEIAFPNGDGFSRRLSVDSENSAIMYAYRVIDEVERRKGGTGQPR